MDNLSNLLKKHMPNMKIGERSVQQLIGFLRKKGKILKFAYNEIRPGVLGCMICNIEGKNDVVPYVKNPEKNIKLGGHIISCYKFIKCDENIDFYKDYAPMDEDYVYVIFEENSKWIYSNCTKLQIELQVERRISQYDFDNKTSSFYTYLSAMEFWEQKWF